MIGGIKYICDDARHLICIPYSIENLHRMAVDLNIHKCWYHSKSMMPHYDIPKRRIEEIKAKCEVVSSKRITQIIKEAAHGSRGLA